MTISRKKSIHRYVLISSDLAMTIVKTLYIVFFTLHETDNNVILHREMATRGVKATCL